MIVCPDCGFNSLKHSKDNIRILQCQRRKCRHDFTLLFMGTRREDAQI